jgi:FtsZ-interacting cell division protein YlmF
VRSRQDARDAGLPTEDDVPTGSPQRALPDAWNALIDHLGRCDDPARLVLVAPERFADCRGFADALSAGHLVVLDVRRTQDDIAKRVVDFASGVVYALQGHVGVAAAGVYLLCPGLASGSHPVG